MRILQVLNTLNWSASSAYCINVSYELIKLGHEVLILTEPGYALNHIKELGIPYDDRLSIDKYNIFSYLDAIKLLKKTYKSFKPDIVSAHVNKNAWMPAVVAKLAFPQAVVVRVRQDIASPNRHLLNLWVHHKLTDHIICGSELHKEICCKNLFLSPEKISIIYGSVDSDKFNPNAYDKNIRKNLNISEDDFVVCLLGRLSPVKGHEYALKAISLLKDLPVKVKLLCIGYEAQRSFDWLKEEANRLGILDRLITVDYCDNLPAVLNSIDVGIISSLGSEANSRAALEYMACEKAVVATKVGVLPELIKENENGFLVEPGNSEALANALKELALNKEMCKLFGKASRRIVEENYTIKEFGKKTEALYKSLLERNNI